MGSRWCILATKELNYQELKDIIYGAAFLGAGGGGSVVQGMAMVKEVVDSGKKVVLVDLDSVRDDGLAAVSAGMGSPAAAKHGWRNEHLPAFDLLEKYLGKKVDYVVPIEIGAGNIAVPLHTAAFRGKYLVDADGAGRAIPELELTTFEIYGVPISPMAISDWEGDGAILFTKDSLKAERIARQIVVAFEGCAGIALYPMSGAQLKNVVIPGTISLSQKVGSLLRKVREENLDVCEVLSKELGGYVLGVGKVTSKTLEMRGGFDFGVVEVELKGGGKLRVHFKNENIVAERDRKVIAVAPDLICWVTTSGEPLTNVDVDKGMEVAVIGLKAHERLRTEKALKAFKHLYSEVGFNIEYKPIEELIK